MPVKKVYFVEYLTLDTLFLHLAPSLFRGIFKPGDAKCDIYFVDASRIGIFTASILKRIARLSVKKLEFRLIEIKDADGVMTSAKVFMSDLGKVQKDIIDTFDLRKITHKMPLAARLKPFLAKQIISSDAFGNEGIGKSLFLIRVAAWKTAKEYGSIDTKAVFILTDRGWCDDIRKYACGYGISAFFARNRSAGSKDILLRMLGPKAAFFVNIPFWFSVNGVRHLFGGNRPEDTGAKICTEYYGHLNLDDLKLHSDLFFFRNSGLRNEDLLLAFHLPEDPLDKNMFDQLKRHGISAVALAPKKTATFYRAPIFVYKPDMKNLTAMRISNDCPERAWFKRQTSYYQILFDYWCDFFRQNNVKIYLSWLKYNSTHCAMADAIESLGGVSAIYQRSFDQFPCPSNMTASDIVFGFGKNGIEQERLSRSDIRYYVTTGYPGDYRFALLKDYAGKVREALRAHGAEKILAYCDGNSTSDSRWNVGHEFVKEDYDFLLKKVLAEPWFGLILKPKAPASLRKRLGPVAELLKKSEETGRCFVFEGGAIQGSYPPAAAGLGADVAVDHLLAATAGAETALAGVPTLLIDRERSPMTKFHTLEKDKVIFRRWDDLWTAFCDHCASREGMPGFGDWSALLDDIDPFRDGMAAQRMGSYLKWLLDGLKKEISREKAMEDAANRYRDLWGSDKITEIRKP